LFSWAALVTGNENAKTRLTTNRTRLSFFDMASPPLDDVGLEHRFSAAGITLTV
jgi:hypothetical protein